jgi:hypothetical protein
MVCRYCGQETGSGVGHCSQTECIQALNDEIARARQLIDRAREEQRRGPSHTHAVEEAHAAEQVGPPGRS